MAFAPELRSHAQQVCTLYKQCMRNIEGYYVGRPLIRYQQVQLRARFDENKGVSDPKEQRRLLWVGQHDLFKVKHPLPLAKFAYSLGIAGGVAYARVVEPPDWVMDYWHPLEKEQYPIYFRTREERKCEFIDKWYRGELC